MKILHTADWHVGQGIRGRSRATEHQDVLAEIVDITREHEVDLVLVIGDQFHTGAPSPESETIVYRALMGLAQTEAHVHVLAGNHDNPHRLRAIAPLLELTNVTAGWLPAGPDQGGVIEIDSKSGETAVLASIPFLSKRTIVRADDIMHLDPSEHEGKYRERYRQIVEALTGGFSANTINLIAAHVTVQGGSLAGGERTSQSIFDYIVPSSVFPETAHYVAVGHLHGTQRIDGGAPIWYPGSPLQMDFGDASKKKGILLIEAEPGVPAKVETIHLTSGRRLRTVRGSLAQLESQAQDFGDDYLRVELDEKQRAGLADEIRELLPNVVDVTLAEEHGASTEEEAGSGGDFRGSPEMLFSEFLSEKGIEDTGVVALFEEVLEEWHAPNPT